MADQMRSRITAAVQIMTNWGMLILNYFVLQSLPIIHNPGSIL